MSETQADPAAPPQAPNVNIVCPKPGEGDYSCKGAPDGSGILLEYVHPEHGRRVIGSFESEQSVAQAIARNEGFLEGFHAGVPKGFEAGLSFQEPGSNAFRIGTRNRRVSIERFGSGWIVKRDDRPLDKHQQHASRDFALIAAGYEIRALDMTVEHRVVIEQAPPPPQPPLAAAQKKLIRFEKDAKGSITSMEIGAAPETESTKNE